MAKAYLESLIQKSLKIYTAEKGLELPAGFAYDLVVTRDPSHGDLAVNAAFKMAGLLRQKPPVIAAEFLKVLEAQNAAQPDSVIERMVIAGGAFINFYLKKASLGQVLIDAVRQDRDFGKSDFGKGKKVLLEYVSANPTGPLTIAHGRQAAIGDSLYRILKATGHETDAEYYLNDGGRQMNLLGKSLWARYCQELQMNAELPEDGYQGAYMIDLARKLVAEKRDALLKESEDKAIEFCRIYACEEIMGTIRKDLQDFRVEFDHYFSEQTLYKKNNVQKCLEFLQEKGHLYEQEGALWFRSTAFGDDKDRVIRKTTGEYTYLAPDIAYHRYKFDRGYNKLVDFLGPDHHGYINRIKASCQALGYDAGQIEIRIVQLSTLFRNGQPVRMSTRAGEFVTLRELMDEVGIDAARFFFIMRKVESHLDFDLDLAKQKSQENPVYYLQYAHARICSILRNADREVATKVNLELLKEEEETNLIKFISDYPKALVQASEFLEPYRLTDYLHDLAMCFHKFYSAHRVLTDDQELTKARLLLADAARVTLRNGLELLGISQPESM